MSLLATINTGRKPEGARIVIAGQEKLGKTTLATGAPAALLMPLEIGYASVTIAKTAPITSYQQYISGLDEIIYYAQRGQFPYKTLITDSGTALEKFIHTDVLMTDPMYEKKANKNAVTMESALGGYGKAYTYANEKFANVLARLDYLASEFGINIVVTCHVFAAKVMDPQSGEYDSWDLLLHSPKNSKTYGKREMITQWADFIGFLYEPMYITKGAGETMTKGVSAQKGRMLGVSRTPAYVAGNRYGMIGEIPIPKDQGWNYLAHALYQSAGIDLYNRDLK